MGIILFHMFVCDQAQHWYSHHIASIFVLVPMIMLAKFMEFSDHRRSEICGRPGTQTRTALWSSCSQYSGKCQDTEH